MQEKDKQSITEGVLEHFMKFAVIPRPSGHEQAISDFLKKYLTELGMTVQQDEVNDIIADLPATPGLESAPLTILQGHMDMVCVAEEGREYDPLHDPIKVVRDEKYLSADGTSLGGDDGIGVSVAIYSMLHAAEHGPLRLIVTVDEEQGMTGAKHLAKEHLQDAKYLLNCDSENYDEITVGSAGSVNIDFVRELERCRPEYSRAYSLTIKGLKGGHSGERIGDGRANALRTLALAVLHLRRAAKVELASFTGGKARNAIPDAARAVIVTEASADELQRVLDAEVERYQEIYGSVDPAIELTLAETELPQNVYKNSFTTGLLQLLTILHTGVFAMSTAIPGLVETSANLGVVREEGNQLRVMYFPRSGIDAELEEIALAMSELADLTGFAPELGTPSPGWKENEGSWLAKVMPEIFAEQNPGHTMKVLTIHAGLECGFHYRKNPELDMISTGVTSLDIHSPNEHIELATIAPQVELIMETLRRIAHR